MDLFAEGSGSLKLTQHFVKNAETIPYAAGRMESWLQA